MVEIKTMSKEELKYLIEEAQREIKRREDERFHELASVAIDSIKALKKEFPFAWYDIEVEMNCDYGRETVEIDILDYIEDASWFYK